jgi:hypothetical protein
MMLAGVIHAAAPGNETAEAAALVDRQWVPDRSEIRAVAPKAVRLLIPLIIDLSRVRASRTLTESTASRVSHDLLQLAHTLRQQDPAIAMACAFSSGNFSVFDPGLAEASARLVLEFGDGDDPAAAVMTNAHLAHVLARVAAKEPSRRADAYIAFERTLHLARIHHEPLGQFERVFEDWLSHQAYLRPLQLLFWTTCSPDTRPELRNTIVFERASAVIDVAKVAGLLDVILPGDPETFRANVATLRDWAIASENLLLELAAPAGASFAQVTWSNASVHHPALIRPGLLDTLFERLIASDHPCAARTLAWIDAHDWTSVPGETDIDVSAWARSVRDGAARLATKGVREDGSARIYAAFVCGESRASELVARGLGDLQDLEGSVMANFVRFLYESGRLPVSGDLADLALTVTETLVPLMSCASGDWDFRLPASALVQGG